MGFQGGGGTRQAWLHWRGSGGREGRAQTGSPAPFFRRTGSAGTSPLDRIGGRSSSFIAGRHALEAPGDLRRHLRSNPVLVRRCPHLSATSAGLEAAAAPGAKGAPKNRERGARPARTAAIQPVHGSYQLLALKTSAVGEPTSCWDALVHWKPSGRVMARAYVGLCQKLRPGTAHRPFSFSRGVPIIWRSGTSGS